MFQHADIIVQGVMVGLIFASVVTWTILIAKAIELAASVRAVRRSVAAGEEDRTLTGRRTRLGAERGAAGAFGEAAMAEMRLSLGSDPAGIKDRIASRLHRLEATFARRATRGTGLLATIGSTSPFVGLFGTVWGIMNSFIGISQSHTTSLAVVAPGIAEAPAGDGDRVGGGDPGGGDLQRVRARHWRLSRRARQPVGPRPAVGIPRTRHAACHARRSGLGHGVAPRR